MKNYSPLLFTDSYKVSHAGFSPNGLAGIYSNFTPRYSHYFKDKYPAFNDKYVQFGVQYAFKRINDMFSCFFAGNLKEEMDKISSVLNPYIGEQDMGRFESLHKLGYLPIEVRSIEEGSLVNMGVPSFTVRNTHPDFAWLTNYLETLISAEVWKPLTIATIAKEFRNLSLEFSEKTCNNDLHVKFQNHDFSYRGQSGSESDMINSVAWLTQSIGTDNIPGIMCAKEYYQADDCNVIALSVPASEHSVATLGILSVDNEDLENGEATFLARVLEEYYPKGIVSYVADSYDFWSVITEILPSLKEEIMNREGKLVIRPDSGDPVLITAGYNIYHHQDGDSIQDSIEKIENFPFSSPTPEVFCMNGRYYDIRSGFNISSKNQIQKYEAIGTVAMLWEIFGGYINDKHFKVLDDHIGMIYGDGITYARAKEIFERLSYKGFASSNVVFGIGSYTLNMISRDDLGCAIKATHATYNGEEISLYKNPKTDSTKKSAKGYLFVYETDNGLELESDVSFEKQDSDDNMLKLLFRDGVFSNCVSLDSIRSKLNFKVEF